MKGLSKQQLDSLSRSLHEDQQVKTLQGVMAKTEYADLAYLPQGGSRLNGDFTIEIKTNGITAQQKSGRCWMFALMNMLRETAARKLNLKKFELSGNYLAFYDKLEKCNNFLEMVIANYDKPLNDRMMEYILNGIGDGGYFDMARDLVKKYGVVPADVMPETYQSTHTEKFRRLQNSLLRKDAMVLREALARGEDVTELKGNMVAEIYKAQCIAFGTPVDKFDFAYRDKDNNYHVDHDITPQQFYDCYIGTDLDEYITVTNHPTAGLPLESYYHFHYMGNMADKDCYALNLSMDDLQQLCLSQLSDGEAVWFGCDAGAFGDRKMGLWDPDSFVYQGLLGGADFCMEKGHRLMYHDSYATHAMILTGVNLDAEGHPERWKIENSWGKDVGKDGYFVCSQHYFREYVYEAIINKKHLTEQQKELLKKEPFEIKPWESDSL